MKLAHLILTHDNPMQLERLVKRLSHIDADIYIHLDLKTKENPYLYISDMPNTFFIKEVVNVQWGEYSVIEATLNGLKEILARGIQYSHINLLSGADYPLRSSEEIHNFLFANAGKTFMWYDLIFNDWQHGQARINNYYLGYYNFPGRYYLNPLLNKLMPKRKLPAKIKACGRSQWLTLTPECAAYTLQYIKDNPAMERFFKMTWAVDEVFFQTILCNSSFRDTLINDNLRYIVLEPNFRPHVFTIADADALLSSDKLYARKFDNAIDSAILDHLDKMAGR